ncbi:MAG: Wzz/FepE/Etk N-terminal domain-containing protein [Pseudomonadales bacterium]
MQTSNTLPELELDVIKYVAAVIEQWKLILGAAIVTAALVYGYCQTLPNVYEAFARVALNDPEDPGGIKPDERRASEVLTLVEHGFVMGTSRNNYHEVMRARLRSRVFTHEFMHSHGVYPVLFPEHWDELQGAWHAGYEPNKAEAIKRFGEQIRVIEHNPETDIITIRMRWTDPELARRWANDYVAAFNDYIRRETLAEVERKQAYLYAELENSDVVDIQKSIYRLIEAQTAIAMLANSRDQYVLEVIDPATLPFDRFSPAPRRFTIFGFVAGFMLVVSVILARLLLQGMITSLNQFRQSQHTSLETT